MDDFKRNLIRRCRPEEIGVPNPDGSYLTYERLCEAREVLLGGMDEEYTLPGEVGPQRSPQIQSLLDRMRIALERGQYIEYGQFRNQLRRRIVQEAVVWEDEVWVDDAALDDAPEPWHVAARRLAREGENSSRQPPAIFAPPYLAEEYERVMRGSTTGNSWRVDAADASSREEAERMYRLSRIPMSPGDWRMTYGSSV